LKKILLVRTDRIGDVVLSLPAAAMIKGSLPGVQVHFLTRGYTAPLAAMSSEVDEVVVDEGGNFLALSRRLRGQGYDAAVLLHPELRLALALWLAAIPIRVGTAYRAYSPFFNRKVPLHRRSSLRHELELNLELVSQGLGLAMEEGRLSRFVPMLRLDRKKQEELQKSLGWQQGRTIILHPGSGGSARDWPLSHFSLLASLLLSRGYRVAVSLGPDEDRIRDGFHGSLAGRIHWLQGLDLGLLATAISLSRLMVANSTGPLHLATAVGTKALGLYCPIKPCRPQRWGPYGPGHRALLPEVPGCDKCLGSRCRYWDCMSTITVDRVLENIEEMLS